MKWKHFPRYWPFVRGSYRWIPHRKASDAELWCFLWSAPCINDRVNNREAGDLRRHCAHYDVIVMKMTWSDWVTGLISHPLRSETLNLLYKINYYSDFTCTLWRLNSPATRLSFQQLVPNDHMENNEAPHCWILLRGVHILITFVRGILDSSREGPVIREAFQWPGVIYENMSYVVKGKVTDRYQIGMTN